MFLANVSATNVQVDKESRLLFNWTLHLAPSSAEVRSYSASKEWRNMVNSVRKMPVGSQIAKLS